jgi:iron complex transport system ATP-binding protein
MSQLAATDLHMRLGDKQVLRGVTALFARGTVTAIVGPNGAGKSTLLTALVGLHKPDRGQVHLDGVDIYSLPARARARRIAFLPQIPEIAWAVEARTLIALGRTPFTGARGLGAEDEAAVDLAIAKANVGPLEHRNVLTLSGGERARVLLARALAGEPEWLLADEPLTGLDPGHQLDAANLMRELATEGRGVIVTLHDLHIALRVADRVIVLAEGMIAADGPGREALTPEILSAAYGIRGRIWEGEFGPVIEVLGRG